MYDICQFSRQTRNRTFCIQYYNNFLYQCVLHNSTAIPRTNSTQPSARINNYVNYCCAHVYTGT